MRADTYGFVSKFQIYTGKIDGRSEKLLGEKIIYILTTISQALVFHKVLTALKIALDYNSFMRCVDKADMFKSTFELDRKSKKW